MSHRNKKVDFILNCIIILLLVILMVLSSSFSAETASSNSRVIHEDKIEQVKQSKELISTPVKFEDVKYTNFYDMDLVNEYHAMLLEKVYCLESAIASGDYTADATNAMIRENERLLGIATLVESDIKHFIAWEQEYYYATGVFRYLMNKGYSRVAASAIIGNMMVEVGGKTLNLKPTIYSKNKKYYGLCQWSVTYYPEAKNLSFEAQLDYLLTTIEAEFNTFGNKYRSGFTYDDFLSMENPAEAALAFAKVYERCATWSINSRMTAAEEAYAYFDLSAHLASESK